MKSLLLTVMIICFCMTSHSQNMYACFQNDKDKNMQVWVCYNENNKPQFVKHKGDKDSLRLNYSAGDSVEVKDSELWSVSYNEVVKGKKTGQYTFTHDGPSHFSVTYFRQKDGKLFFFDLIPASGDEGNKIYRKESCF